jgi:hypothetical protein
MSYGLTVPTQVVGAYDPRSLSPLSARRIAEERGIERPQVFIIEAPLFHLPVVMRDEVVLEPDAQWHKLSGQAKCPRAENLEGRVTWEEFLETMRQFLQHMVNSEFMLMNETFTGGVEQLSVRNHLFKQAGEYMMGEMARLV